MFSKNVVAVSIRIFAISLVFYALRACIQYYSSGASASTFVPLLTVSISVVGAYALWFFSYRLAGLMLPVSEVPEVPEPLTAGVIESVGICIFAISIIWSAMVDLFYWLSFYFYATAQGIGIGAYDVSSKAGITATLFQLAGGVVLLCGVKAVVRGINALRTAGLPKNG